MPQLLNGSDVSVLAISEWDSPHLELDNQYKNQDHRGKSRNLQMEVVRL